MGLTNENSYAFDECSILKLCKISIPNSYQVFFREKNIYPRNYTAVRKLVDSLDHKTIPKHRFVPANFESNAIKMVNQIIENKDYHVQMLGETFRAQILDQIEEFYDKITNIFKDIMKDDDITHIRKVFVDNERNLKKEKNIPEDDDLKIISGYIKFEGVCKKLFITEDEHFLGYSDLLLKNFKINVINESDCGGLC